jgi:hypothetical protein
LKEAIATQILLGFLLRHYVVFIDGVSLKSEGAPGEVPSLEVKYTGKIEAELSVT